MSLPYSWLPKRNHEETDAILCAPGHIHELETRLVDGRLQRVYKNLWPSLRGFWLAARNNYANETYIVFYDQRISYAQTHTRAVKAAAVFKHLYGIRKGDRVAICSRNCPDFLVAFWACHLLGAVAVLPNAWLPLDPLYHCLTHTESKLIITDTERADLLHTTLSKISQKVGTTGFLVFDDHLPMRTWQGMESFRGLVNSYPEKGLNDIIGNDPKITPEDNATIIFTSGTTGLPKGVLSTHRQFLTNVLNVLVGSSRASLRRGDDYPPERSDGPQKGALVAFPLFHVTGITSYSMMATLTGMKIVMTRKWDVGEAVKLIKQENIAVAGGVPAMVADLIDSSLVGYPLEGLLFGGSPANDSLVPRAQIAFPKATMSQAYGLTETNSIAVSFAGEDHIVRPSSTGRVSPVNDIRIVKDGLCLPPGNVGEVWLRGPNVMKGYWKDPDATNKVITSDGWLMSGDLGYLDEEGFLFIKDRLKDVINRGGENVDSVSVENAFYADPRIMEAAAVGVPDERLGELVACAVFLKPAFCGTVTETGLIEDVRKRLPRFAVPVMVYFMNEPFQHTPSGKIMKGEIRKVVRSEWEARCRGKTRREPSVNL